MLETTAGTDDMYIVFFSGQMLLCPSGFAHYKPSCDDTKEVSCDDDEHSIPGVDESCV